MSDVTYNITVGDKRFKSVPAEIDSWHTTCRHCAFGGGKNGGCATQSSPLHNCSDGPHYWAETTPAAAKDTPTKLSNPKDAAGDKKIPLWLCSAVAKAHWAVAQFAGLIKYGAWNWRVAGVRSSVYVSALQRHIDCYSAGEEFDLIDGTHHLGNIMACAAILLDAKAAGKLTDDRAPRLDVRPTYAELEATMLKLKTQYAEYLPGGPKAPKHYTLADAA